MKYFNFLAIIAIFFIFSILLVFQELHRKDMVKIRELKDRDHQAYTKQKKNIFFLKTHKCASSTIQNIFMRFGIKNSLNFALPKTGSYISLHGPSLNETDIAALPTDHKFNILAHHTRFKDDVKSLMYPDTFYVTILREPATQFESLFQYYHLDRRINATLTKVINSFPRQRFAMRIKGRIYGFNQMSWDLGLDDELLEDKSEIDQFINNIDHEFDMVLICEYMEASLVLLADAMHWPLEYVTFLPINSRLNKSKLTDNDKVVLSKINYADTLLYQHFLKKFSARVKIYGADRLKEGVQQLMHLNENIKYKCIDHENSKGYAKTKGYDLKNTNDIECFYITSPELKFTTIVKERQVARLRTLKKLDELIYG